MAIQFPFDKFRHGLIKCGLQEATYDEYLPEWIKESGDTEQSRKDYIWHLYQLLLTSIAKEFSNDSSLWVKLKFVYCEMSVFLSQEEKDRYVALKGIAHCDLQNAASTGLKVEAGIIGGNRCPEAEKINGKRFPLSVMLESSLLPYDKCTRDGGCICCYGFHTLRDSNDRLIQHEY